MANTIVYGTKTVGLNNIDSDYDFGADVTLGSPGSNYIIIGMLFFPSGPGDKICILDGAAAAKPPLLYQTDIMGAGLSVYPGIPCRPFLVASNCLFADKANAWVTIIYTQTSELMQISADITAIKATTDNLPADPVTDLLNGTIEGDMTVAKVLRVFLAQIAGKVNVDSEAVFHFRDQANTKDRLVAQYTGGNREIISLDGS